MCRRYMCKLVKKGFIFFFLGLIGLGGVFGDIWFEKDLFFSLRVLIILFRFFSFVF